MSTEGLARKPERLSRSAIAVLVGVRRWFSRLPSLVRQDPHPWVLGALVVAFAALYTIAGFVEHRAYRTALYDLGIYDQAMQGFARSGLPHVPIFGVRSADDAGLLHWTDHFTPILVVLTPFYWIHRGPETLLVAHGVLFAVALIPLWSFTRAALGVVPAYLVVIAHALSWQIQQAVWFPFHQVAFAVPLIAFLLERYQTGDYRRAAWIACSLLLVREDLGLLVSAFGVLLLFKGARRLGLGLAFGGLLATWLITALIMPLLGGSPRRNWTYWYFGNNPLELVWTVVRSPLASLEYMLTPAEKVRTLLWLFAPLLFLSLRSRLVLLALPLLAVRMMSTQPHHWSLAYHYNAFVAPILFFAAVDGVRSLAPISLWRARSFGWGPAWSGLVLAFTLLSLPRWPAWRVTERAFWYPRTPRVKAAERAVAQVPDDAFIAAANRLGAHLTHRAKVRLWVPKESRHRVLAEWKLEGFNWRYHGDRPLPLPTWVLADTGDHQFPFASVEEQRAEVRRLLATGYGPVYESDGFVLLRRP
jgi:uncharacterized membrane protein